MILNLIKRLQLTKKHPWLFRLTENYTWDASELIDYDFEFNNEWLRIHHGLITVKKGYAWDGCSYKWSIADLWVIGVPDGRQRYGLPMTYHASLIHDALTQFRHVLPITHQQATAIFAALLDEAGFFWRHVYVLMITVFGKRDFLGNQLQDN